MGFLDTITDIASAVMGTFEPEDGIKTLNKVLKNKYITINTIPGVVKNVMIDKQDPAKGDMVIYPIMYEGVLHWDGEQVNLFDLIVEFHTVNRELHEVVIRLDRYCKTVKEKIPELDGSISLFTDICPLPAVSGEKLEKTGDRYYTKINNIDNKIMKEIFEEFEKYYEDLTEAGLWEDDNYMTVDFSDFTGNKKKIEKEKVLNNLLQRCIGSSFNLGKKEITNII